MKCKEDNVGQVSCSWLMECESGKRRGLLDLSQVRPPLGLRPAWYRLMHGFLQVSSKFFFFFFFKSLVLFGFLVECLGVICVCFWLGDFEVCMVRDEE